MYVNAWRHKYVLIDIVDVNDHWMDNLTCHLRLVTKWNTFMKANMGS